MSPTKKPETHADIMIRMRKRLGMTLRELATVVGCNHTMCQHMEHGRIKERRNYYLAVKHLMTDEEKAALVEAEARELTELLKGWL